MFLAQLALDPQDIALAFPAAAVADLARGDAVEVAVLGVRT